MFVTDWLSDLMKTSSHTKAPTDIILELSKVLAQLNLSKQGTEEWMAVLVSLCNLTDSCLGAVRKLDQGAMCAFLQDSASLSLTSIVLDTGMRVFRHIDRNQTKRARSEGYLAWNQKALNLTKNLLEFLGEQVQQSQELREHAGDMTISGRYAEEARCEYAYLNLTFKCITMLVPNCEENRALRLDTQSAIHLLCEGILGSFMDIFMASVESNEVNDVYISRRWTLAKFYISHLRPLASHLFKDICSLRSDAATCRGLVRYLLFFMRGRFTTSETIKRNHPQIQSEIVKVVGIVEDILVSTILETERASDDDKHAVIHEFSMAPGPRAAFSFAEPLSEYEWDVGRLKFLLKIIGMFDEFPETLQLHLYPPKRIAIQDSLFDRVVDCVDTINTCEFLTTLPLGTACTKVASLIGSMVKTLDGSFQLTFAADIMAMIDRMPSENLHTLLSCFPYDSLSSCVNLDSLTNRCTDEWRHACSLLSDEHVVVDAFYAMHPHVACLASIFSNVERRRTLSDDIKVRLIGWSAEILGDAHGLLKFVQDDIKSLRKVSRTIEDIVAFLQSMQPLQSAELILFLNAIVSWEDLPFQCRPLPRASIARFLASCCAVEISEDSHMAEIKNLLVILYNTLLSDSEWVVIHATLMSLVLFKKGTRYPQLLDTCIPEAFHDVILSLLKPPNDKTTLSISTEDSQLFWSMVDVRTKCLRSQKFSNHTVSDLQTMSGSLPTSYACMSALSTVAEYLKALNNAQVDNHELRNKLTEELARIQRLAQNQNELPNE
ncbi:hypothetical protein BGZ65_002762 [Modicella reniformis]|uniref:Uncharacterized protein n=1 Tax=Modicella reniformis TaxID=1440133 RepID=A0A9P6M9J1_9FUNG|nr:hypothetical protein BGZ65_002762 [Modicella reniformis]